jgi:hypothetical protein
MWRNSDIIEELTTVPPPRPDPPPTPRMGAATRVQWQRGDPDKVEPLSTSHKKGGVIDELQRGRSKTVTQKDGKDDSALPDPSASPKQTYEQRTEMRRRSEEQSQRNVAAYIKAMEEESKQATYSPADDGGVNLKPLTPMPSKEPALKPLTPLPPDHQSQKPGVARKRGASMTELEAERANRIIKAEKEWMSDDPVLRDWAQDSREELYGEGVDVAETRSFLSYPPPTRNTDEINRELYDMTLRDQDYQIGGPPRAVDINNIDWDTDVSNVQGYREFQQAREAKAFASYVMFTERQEEIDMLRRMQVHGFLKDGVDIKYGYQAQGPHGAFAWLTNEGQEIGGRLREEYEQERAVAGEFVIIFVGLARVRSSEVQRSRISQLRAVHADLSLAPPPRTCR